MTLSGTGPIPAGTLVLILRTGAYGTVVDTRCGFTWVELPNDQQQYPFSRQELRELS